MTSLLRPARVAARAAQCSRLAVRSFASANFDPNKRPARTSASGVGMLVDRLRHSKVVKAMVQYGPSKWQQIDDAAK